MSTSSYSRSYYTPIWPWGKHKNERIADCPSSYLLWALENASMEPGLEDALRAELSRRIGHFTPPHQWPEYRIKVPTHVDPDVAAEIVDAGKRALSLRHHPDLGGSTVAMQQINTAADWLLEHLAEVFVSAGVRR